MHELEPFVLFVDGQPTEKRHFVNAKTLLPRLKEAFPGALCLQHLFVAHLFVQTLQLSHM